MSLPHHEPAGAITTVVASRPEVRLERLRRFAHWMDAGLTVPFTSIRFGLDPIIGLVPGLGDAAGALLSSWILVEAVRLGASRATVARMAGNIAVDVLTGTVPVLGDLFDVAWKANLRNVALIERHVGDPVGARRSDRGLVIALAAGVVLVLGAIAVVGAWIGMALLRALLS